MLRHGSTLQTTTRWDAALAPLAAHTAGASVAPAAGPAPISVWLEVCEVGTDRWLAVDPVFLEALRSPATQWMHRGTPMIWVCAADDRLRGGDACLLRDVTHRYSPVWWRVEQARGPVALLEWWHQTLAAPGGGRAELPFAFT